MRRFAPDSHPHSLCLTPALVGAVLIALGVLMIVLPEPVLARTNDLMVAVNRYPQIDNTNLDSCDLCHGTSYNLNLYGSDYDTYGFADIENIDSDDDGFLNIDEINALTEPGDASDHPHDDVLVLSKYPGIAGTRLDSCDLCHSNGTSLNPYGTAYLNNGRNLAAFDLFENEDTDGDSFSNIDEVNELTFPGDGGDYPVIECQDMTRLREKYPDITGTRLDTCILCHTDGSGTNLNSYGADYRDSGRNLTAFGLIEAVDSDGDTFTNLAEINELTFPGNASDMPGAEHNYETLLTQQYPTIDGTRLTSPDTCNVCHNTGQTTLNAYGSDYATDFDFVAIENIDSDNDEFVNVDEIELFFYPGNSVDHPDDLDLVMSLYSALPEIESHGCHLCHTDESGPDLNPYGADYLSNGRTRAALVAIENLDSDGDGYCNLDELELGYCPGEPECPTHSESLLIQYPYLEGTQLDSCDLCHGANVPDDFNLYGKAYINAGKNRFAFGLIEQLDSDVDGYVNLEEIEALSMPGDPTDIPAQSGGSNTVFLPIILKL